MSIEEATRICQNRRDENVYRCHHSPKDSLSATSEEDEEGDDIDAENSSNSDEDSQIVSIGSFDNPQPIAEYENVRWTLVRPPSSTDLFPTTSTITAPSSSTVEFSPLVQKYGLTGSLLMAKQRFFMADPEPIRIDSRSFRAAKNKERTTETILPDCTEQVDFLPEATSISLPLTYVDSSLNNETDFSRRLEITKIIPSLYCPSPNKMNLTLNTNPMEPLIPVLSVPPLKTESLVSSIVGESIYVVDRGIASKPDPLLRSRNSITISEAFPGTSANANLEKPHRSSAVQIGRVIECPKKSDIPNSTALSDCAYVLTANTPPSDGVDVEQLRSLPTSSSEEEESEGDMELLHRALVQPPAELGVQLKKSIDKAVPQKGIPLYILTSKLDSDDDDAGQVIDPQDMLEDDEEEDTTDSSSDEPFLPISNLQAKQVAALKSRLTQLEKEMLELEIRGKEKERALRVLDELIGPSETQSLVTQFSFTSEPDLSACSKKRSSKREVICRRWWVPSKLSMHNSLAEAVSRPSVPEQEMIEHPERARILGELLSVISARNKLVTQEAVIVAELKKIQLEAYEESLQQAYDSLKHPVGEVEVLKEAGVFRFHGGGRLFKKDRIFPGNRELSQEGKGKQLLNEIWKISREKETLTAVQSETVER